MTAAGPLIKVVTVDEAAVRAWVGGHTAEFGVDDAGLPDLLPGLDDLIAALRDTGPTSGWHQHPLLRSVGVWCIATGDRVIDGAIVTADLRVGADTVRLASLHQDLDDILGPPTGTGVDTVVHALGTVARLVNDLVAGHRVATPALSGSDDGTVGRALNAAADDLLTVTGANGEAFRDAVNLLVNTAMHYLRGAPGSDAATAYARLSAVAADGYDADLDTILEWIPRSIR